jgi:bifunctional non-homologous end joining protein LigD
LLDRPWHERRATLERLDLAGHPAVALSPVYPDGPALLAATAQRGMEGVVAKARESGYRPGRTSPDWVAASHRRRRMCLVGGWRPAVDGAVVDALLLGVPDGRGGLRYAGAVDTGHVEDAVQRVLAKRLAVDGARRRPFSGVLPRAEVTGTLWCAPRTVVEVDHLGVAADGRLRRPLFRAVRDDVAPDAVADE